MDTNDRNFKTDKTDMNDSIVDEEDSNGGLRFRHVGPMDRSESTFSNRGEFVVNSDLNVESIRDAENKVVDSPSTTSTKPSRHASGNGGIGGASGNTFTRSIRPTNLMDFFMTEITRGYALENDEARYSEKRKKVYAFMKIPRELERFLFYGFLQCTDAFLYIFTLLPIRFVLAMWHLIVRLFVPINGKSASSTTIGGGNNNRYLAPSEMCDLLKVFIIVTSSVIMTFIDTSWMYHVVRGQAVIKLYILYNMLEVADKLFSSFGQDILDALFWTATEPHSSNSNNQQRSSSTNSGKGAGGGRPRSHLDQLGMGTLAHLAIAVLYVIGHAVLVLFQATTLNVAFNSHNKALLTILLSNNFVELKGSVFKKFAKNNLFQMACSDVRERFHNLILLSVVVVRNMTAVNWRAEHFWEMVPDLALVVFGEFMVDWFKHAFITKFNDIPYEVYKDFTITIAYDVARSRQKTAFSDHSDQVSRRMGFIPLPLGVLMIRILSQSLSRSLWHWWTPSIMILLGVLYAALLSLKLVNSIVLLGEACKHIETYEEMQKQADLLKRLRKQKAKSVPASPKLCLIEFNDVMQQSHATGRVITVSDVLQQAAEELAHFANDKENNPASIVDSSLKPHRRSKSVVQFGSPRSRHPSTDRDKGAAGVAASPPPGEKSAPGGGVGVGGPSAIGDPGGSESGGTAGGSNQPHRKTTAVESLHAVDRYTLCNDDRIVS